MTSTRRSSTARSSAIRSTPAGSSRCSRSCSARGACPRTAWTSSRASLRGARTRRSRWSWRSRPTRSRVACEGCARDSAGASRGWGCFRACGPSSSSSRRRRPSRRSEGRPDAGRRARPAIPAIHKNHDGDFRVCRLNGWEGSRGRQVLSNARTGHPESGDCGEQAAASAKKRRLHRDGRPLLRETGRRRRETCVRRRASGVRRRANDRVRRADEHLLDTVGLVLENDGLLPR